MKYLTALIVALVVAAGFGIAIGQVGAGTGTGNVLTVAMLAAIVFAVRRVLRKS